MSYKERIQFIAAVLTFLSIPYEMRPLYEGWQLIFPWCDGDVACHRGTYEQANGMVETYQFPWDDDDVSVLTPTEAAIKIVSLYGQGMI